ncbi:hypothetical protein CDL15_Pgr019581 [Punica granatum]|uniref:Squalene synthase n=1 Tax=Punica granatum TaxID=22663 RepID=A0A218X701_PUNGR|nr:hypothetical protein CDL15_Pgr019581 [Punica granatum]
MTVMRRLGEMVRRPDEIYPSMKWTMMVRAVQKQLPPQPHWAFCYSMLLQATRNLGFSILQLPLQLRKPMMIFYLVLRALDTIEDDMSLSSEVKIPILIAFHEHIYDHDWQFSCKQLSLNFTSHAYEGILKTRTKIYRGRPAGNEMES